MNWSRRTSSILLLLIIWNWRIESLCRLYMANYCNRLINLNRALISLNLLLLFVVAIWLVLNVKIVRVWSFLLVNSLLLIVIKVVVNNVSHIRRRMYWILSRIKCYLLYMIIFSRDFIRYLFSLMLTVWSLVQQVIDLLMDIGISQVLAFKGLHIRNGFHHRNMLVWTICYLICIIGSWFLIVSWVLRRISVFHRLLCV